MKKRRTIILVAATATTAVLAALLVCLVFLSHPSELEQAYNQVQVGMTEGEVRQILGEPFLRWRDSCTFSDGKRMLGDGYAWRTKNNSELVAVAFQDGVAIEKGYDKATFPLFTWLSAKFRSRGV
jgi:hypothetical protein